MRKHPSSLTSWFWATTSLTSFCRFARTLRMSIKLGRLGINNGKSRSELFWEALGEEEDPLPFDDEAVKPKFRAQLGISIDVGLRVRDGIMRAVFSRKGNGCECWSAGSWDWTFLLLSPTFHITSLSSSTTSPPGPYFSSYPPSWPPMSW